jgi:hypothetical protein
MIARAAIVAAAVAAAVSGCAADDERATTLTAPEIGTTTLPATTSVPTTTATAPDTTSPQTTTSSPPARFDDDLDPDGFAALLSDAHAVMVDTTAADDARAAAGVEYQLLLRSLADRPELDEAVLDALDPSARPAVERLVRARQFLQARAASRPVVPPPDELPAWRIVEPEPIETLLAHYLEAEALTGIPWYWLAAIHLQETRMGRIDGVSSAGAVGPMQFLPTTWERCCTGDPTVTRDAIIGAATYLAQSGGPDDMAAALYEYNPNDGYVAVVTAYAETLRDEPELYPGYHAFQVFSGTSAGTVRLPIGYSEPEPVDAAAYLAAHPDDAG